MSKFSINSVFIDSFIMSTFIWRKSNIKIGKKSDIIINGAGIQKFYICFILPIELWLKKLKKDKINVSKLKY